MRPMVIRRSLKLASRLWMMSTLTALLFLPSMAPGPDWAPAIPTRARSFRSISSPTNMRQHLRGNSRAYIPRQGDPESFQCQGDLYLNLLNEPLVPLTLWKDLSVSPVQLTKIGPNRYQGTDGQGASGVWDFVLRTPRLHVLLANLTYVSPRAARASTPGS